MSMASIHRHLQNIAVAIASGQRAAVGAVVPERSAEMLCQKGFTRRRGDVLLLTILGRDELRKMQEEAHAKPPQRVGSEQSMRRDMIVLRVTAEEKADLRRYAEERGLTVSDVLRELVTPIFEERAHLRTA